MTLKYLNRSVRCQEIQNRSRPTDSHWGIDPSIEMYEAVSIILVTGVLAILLAWLFSVKRKHVYKEKYGISGSFWYAAGATIQILLFSMLAVQIKTRAPGAKTFLQVVRARFGKGSHIVFCCYALATNIIVTAMLMLGGSTVISTLVKSMSIEYATTLMVFIIGGYTFLGGLGATFYVNYFSTAIIYAIAVIFIFKTFEDQGGGSNNGLGHVGNIFDFVSCAKGPDGNMGSSYLTFVSDKGLMFGLINIAGNFGAVFVDQSYWQSVTAAKPKQGVVGFLLGGLAWFSIPFSFSTAMGLSYVALCAEQGHELLNEDQVNSGQIAVLVANRLLGKPGELMILALVLLAVTSTAASEVLAVTSIVVYDIYAVHLKPYRLTTDTNSCILCGRGRGRFANPRDRCVCVSMTFCEKCHQDNKSRNECMRANKPDYRCPVHKGYRVYNDYLKRLKNWTVVWTTMGIIPFTIILYMIQVSLSWVYMFMGILIGSAVVPIALTMFWEKLTKEGILAGTCGGTILALSVWLGVASTYEGQEVSMLSGNIAAILGGGVIAMIGSILTNLHCDLVTGAEIWENTRDIDNPLSPWMEKYQQELNLSGSHTLEDRPSLQAVNDAFKGAKTMAYSLSTIFSVILVIIWPAAMVSMGIMSYQQFHRWVQLSECWIFLAMVIMIFLPLIFEVWDICSHLKGKRKVGNHEIPRIAVADPTNEIQETHLTNHNSVIDHVI